MRYVFPTTVFLAILLVPFFSWADDSESVAKEIHEANASFMKVFRAADAVAVASLYTRDAQLLPPNYDAVSGKEAIMVVWKKENGVRRLHRDIWNSSIPVPVPASESQ